MHAAACFWMRDQTLLIASITRFLTSTILHTAEPVLLCHLSRYLSQFVHLLMAQETSIFTPFEAATLLLSLCTFRTLLIDKFRALSGHVLADGLDFMTQAQTVGILALTVNTYLIPIYP